MDLSMSYETVARYSKGAAHHLIEMTFPKTPRIAFISTLAGSYTWHFVETYATSIYRTTLIGVAEKTSFLGLGWFLKESWARQIGEFTIDWIALPFITPYIRPETAVQSGILASVVTSLVLNQASAAIEWIKKERNKKLPKSNIELNTEISSGM